MEIESVYAFIDESGTVGAKTGTRFLIVVVLSVSQPRVLELTIRRAIKKYGAKVASGEIKAADFEEVAILRLLQALVKEDLTVMASSVDFAGKFIVTERVASGRRGCLGILPEVRAR